MRCAIFGCNSTNKNKNNEVSFYRFPQDGNVCNIWVFACCRSDDMNIKTSRICGKHFTEDDFAPVNKGIEFGSPKPRRRLKRSATPSLFLMVKMPKKEQCSPSAEVFHPNIAKSQQQPLTYLPKNHLMLIVPKPQQKQQLQQLIPQPLLEQRPPRAETLTHKKPFRPKNILPIFRDSATQTLKFTSSEILNSMGILKLQEQNTKLKQENTNLKQRNNKLEMVFKNFVKIYTKNQQKKMECRENRFAKYRLKLKH